MDKALRLLPSLLAIAGMAALCVEPTLATALTIISASALWGFHFYFTLPPPPGPEVARFVQIEADLAALTKKLDSLATAINMRQLR